MLRVESTRNNSTADWCFSIFSMQPGRSIASSAMPITPKRINDSVQRLRLVKFANDGPISSINSARPKRIDNATGLSTG